MTKAQLRFYKLSQSVFELFSKQEVLGACTIPSVAFAFATWEPPMDEINSPTTYSRTFDIISQLVALEYSCEFPGNETMQKLRERSSLEGWGQLKCFLI